MPNYRKQIWSGDVYEVEEYYSPRIAGQTYARGRNENVTPEQQEEINQRNRVKQLTRLINCNFGPKDWFITLTCGDRQSYESVMKHKTSYIGKVNRACKKKGLPPPKWISVIERGEKGREHIHLIISGGLSAEELIGFWQQGKVILSKLEEGGDYVGLANYISKEPPEERRRRWSTSRNLEKPRIKRTEIKKTARTKAIRVPKGYKEVQRSSYFSEATGETWYMKAIRTGGIDYGTGKTVQRE